MYIMYNDMKISGTHKLQVCLGKLQLVRLN